MTEQETIDGREIADLLPFYAAGTLRADDRALVDAALATDPALRSELALVREEQLAAIESSEALGAPSRQASDRFFKMLDAAPAPKRGLARFDVASWVSARLESVRPRTLAFASMAACLLVVAQAGFIGLKVLPQRGGTYETASFEAPSASVAGTIVLVSFVPNAKAGDISKLLDANKASIVAGPLAGGLYQVRIGEKLLSTAERDKVVARLKSQSALVQFAAPVSSDAE